MLRRAVARGATVHASSSSTAAEIFAAFAATPRNEVLYAKNLDAITAHLATAHRRAPHRHRLLEPGDAGTAAVGDQDLSVVSDGAVALRQTCERRSRVKTSMAVRARCAVSTRACVRRVIRSVESMALALRTG